MEPIDTLDRAVTAATTVVDGIADDQLDLPSPCTEWNVRAVLNHVVTGQLMAQAMLVGRSHPDRKADHLGRRPKATFTGTIAETRDALGQPGVMERTLTTPFGEQPGATVAFMLAVELVVHGWDLARATDQSTDLDPELAEAMLVRVRDQLGERPRHLTPYGEPQPVPAQATAADRLAAYLGRSVVVA